MAQVLARTVLWYLTFVGFAVNYMIRINVNITIVEMVATTTQSYQSVILNQTNNFNVNENNSIPLKSENLTLSHHDILHKNLFLSNRKKRDMSVQSEGRRGFDWNEQQQGLALGSFYWMHWLSQIPGGILAKKYGTKLVFGVANAIGCWLCLLIPIASYWDFKALIFLRVMQGLITGCAWPAMHVLTGKWIPPNERSKFVTAYLGSSIGIAVFYPVFGYVMHWLSWEWVYYMCGILGTIWWFAWLFFVYDSPEEHPRITETEVSYIAKSLGASTQHDNKAPTPWRAILTSRPVWMNVIAQWGGIWGLFTLMTQAPTYFRLIHHWDIRATGLLSGLPHIMRMLFAYGFSMYADFLLRSEKMTRTNVRKLATALCCIVKGLLVLCLAYFGYSSTAAIILMTVATMFHGAVSSGPLASIVDISPNYAGIVLGVSGMVGVIPGFISPIIVGYLTLDNQTIEAWRNVFLICAGMLIVCGIIYVLLGDSSLQNWNSVHEYQLTPFQKEMQLLEEMKMPKIKMRQGQSEG